MRIHHNMISLGLAVVTLLPLSCRENEYGVVDLTPVPDQGTEVTGTYTYSHPCAMYSQADYDYVKASLDDGSAPQAVKDEFDALKKTSYTLKSYTPEPQTEIVRGDPTGTEAGTENVGYAMKDAAAAYQTAMLWKLTADEDYAKKSIEILNAWAAKCKKVTANDANHYLAAGAQGYTFANAAELMQTYSGWNDADKNTFKTWMVEVFASKNKEFMENHSGNCDLHYWSNWDLVNMCSYLSIGILTENDEMVNYVVNYFYNGAGNGCIKNLIQGIHNDPLGTGEEIAQAQESGRDQGHAAMSAAVVANLAQIAYTLYTLNPQVSELDFFSAEDNALLKLGEYVALTNYREYEGDPTNQYGQFLITVDNIPFNTYYYCVDCTCNRGHEATHTQVSNDGRGELRPGWEIYYNHYARIKGLTSGFTYSKKFADKIRPEGGTGDSRYGGNSGAFDQLGWGTLMLYRGN